MQTFLLACAFVKNMVHCQYKRLVCQIASKLLRSNEKREMYNWKLYVN